MHSGVRFLSASPARIGKSLLRCWLGVFWLLAASVACAQIDLDIERRLLADRLVADRAQALADTTERLTANTQERLRLAGEIEQRDRSYQAELAEYRRLITGAVATPNPQRLAALQRFADGERAQAFEALEELDRIAREARRKAARRLADLESAKETRERAAFGAGDLPAAQAAGRSAMKHATDDGDRSVALIELGDVQVAGGDLKGARQSFEESLLMRQRPAAANPSSAEAQRDVAVSMWNLASMDGTSVRWADVAAFLRRLADRGLLPPPDAGFVAEAERRAAAQR